MWTEQWVTSGWPVARYTGCGMATIWPAAPAPCISVSLQRVTNQRATSVTHRVTRGWPWNRTKWWLQEVTRSYYSWTDHCKRTKARNHMKTDRNGKETAFWDQPGLNPIKRCKTNGLNWFNNTEYVLCCASYELYDYMSYVRRWMSKQPANLMELSKRPKRPNSSLPVKWWCHAHTAPANVGCPG